MSNNQYIKLDGNNARIRLEVLILEDDDTKIAYCPALDLSTYGESKEDILKLFEENLMIFFDETCKKGTLENELIRLQWKLEPKNYQPQKASLKKRPTRNVIDSEFITEKFTVPAYCM